MDIKQKLKSLVEDLVVAQVMPHGPDKTAAIEDFFTMVDDLSLKSDLKRGDIYTRHDRCNAGRCLHEFGYINRSRGINIWILVSGSDKEQSFICLDSNFDPDPE